jgi:two-component system sensor histidine kinase YesM
VHHWLTITAIPKEPKLARINAMMNDNSDEIRFERGFGLDNVNKRIKLYYGKQYGLSISSEYQTGTCVAVVIPMTKGDSTKGS